MAYLVALRLSKTRQMRVQGVIYGVGAVALMLAHMRSAVLYQQTFLISAVLVVPAMVGMVIGGVAYDRLPQVLFRRVTLVVLFVSALNLIRKGMLG